MPCHRRLVGSVLDEGDQICQCPLAITIDVSLCRRHAWGCRKFQDCGFGLVSKGAPGRDNVRGELIDSRAMILWLTPDAGLRHRNIVLGCESCSG